MMWCVNTHLGKDDAPAAGRAAAAGWRDPRLWVGIALVAASVLVGVKVLGGADDTVKVWAVRSDMALGQEVGENHLVARRIRFDDAADRERYVTVQDGLPDETTLTRAVGAGELLPRGALGTSEEGLEQVTLFLPSVQMPNNIAEGWVVDVYVTPPAGSEASKGNTKIVLDDVPVIEVPTLDDSFGGGGERQIVVGVEDEQQASIGLVVSAAKDQRIAISRESTS